MATLAKRKRRKASIMVFSSISKRSEHLRQEANYFRNEANTLDRTKIIFEAKRRRSIARQLFSKRKRTYPTVRKLFSKRSEHIRQQENYFRSEANTLDSKTTVFKAKANMADSKKIIFEAKRTHQIARKLFSKRSEHIRQQ